MPHATPDGWLYADWLLIARTLWEAKHENCCCYECDTLDSLIDDSPGTGISMSVSY